MKKMQRNCLTSLVLPALVFFLLLELIPIGEAIWLTVPHTGSKCVSEEIQSNIVVLTDYIVISNEHSASPTVSVKVTAPYGDVLHHRENTSSGQFAFTTKESGTYLACFEAHGQSHNNKEISINIDWKTGIATKDWDSIARKEKIEGVELELRKLDGAVEAIHQNLIRLKDREAEMRIMSENTNSRVAWYSIISLGICIVVSGLQILYLKQYFARKKLI